ncbi:hypothetical protein [Corallococcus carmarthensis]|uniref:Uncharacterized protein n=1 Tax=Corallococcus carmarthensis TaxID=2316728 RepID=A0A3A8K564_9BACT|nr:hypothetical protein [Corallococcus carmarthensis]RKH03190.1 hypothetical protein D7X32_14655 [Corallococcus carmarthensis]
MTSPWFNVPALYCRVHLSASHRSREETMPAIHGYTTHDVTLSAVGTFQLVAAHGDRPYFRNEKVTLRVQARIFNELEFQGGGGETIRRGGRSTFGGVTQPSDVNLELTTEEKHEAYLRMGSMGPFTLKHRIDVWDTSPPKPAQGHVNEEFNVDAMLSLTLPKTPGQVRLDAFEKSLIGSPFSCCDSRCEVRLSGLLRLTPDVPVFHLADDTLDQNPIPHCRVRVLCPDGATREFESDEAGDIFIPRASTKDVYTLLEVLDDRAPQSAAIPGTWTVDTVPDRV